MKAHIPHPAIAQITAKIEEHRTLEADFKNDQTLNLAERALEAAKAAAVEAELEDDSIDPAELVDRRLEARREVEIAEIRLARAKKAVESQASRVMVPIREGGRIAADALREAAEPFGAAVESELRRVLGQHDYDAEQGHYKAAIYRKKDLLFGSARSLESSASVPGLGKAIALLEEADRLIRDAS
jgi:hypothetical protein